MSTTNLKRGGTVRLNGPVRVPAFKTCPACKKMKPASCYGRCVWTRDLLGHKCRDCTNERNRQLAIARKKKQT